MRTLSSAIILITAASLAAQTPAAKPPVRTLKVLLANEIDPSRLLPPPAADGSAAQQREMAEVKRLVASRSAERYGRAKWDAEHEDPSAFSAALGAAFDLKQLPATAKLLDAVVNEQWVAAGTAKNFFHRKFPVAAANPPSGSYEAWTCDTKMRQPGERPLRSYPSGHATLGYALGVVLADLMPEKAQAVMARAADYGYSREVCGDHYHSDVEAGHALGTAVGILLLRSPVLQSQVEAARAELRAAGLTK